MRAGHVSLNLHLSTCAHAFQYLNIRSLPVADPVALVLSLFHGMFRMKARTPSKSGRFKFVAIYEVEPMSKGSGRIVGNVPDQEGMHPSARSTASSTAPHERMELERFSTWLAYILCFGEMSGLHFTLQL